MLISNFDDLDKEAADAVHFEKALDIIAKTNNRSVKEVATLLNRAMDSFRNEHPYYGVEFCLYRYHLSTGFQKNPHITHSSKLFLTEISHNSDFIEDPNPENSGEYSFITDSGYSGNYSAFYFKKSELLRFFIENNLKIPDDFSDALPAAEKSHAFYKSLIQKEIDNFFSKHFPDDTSAETSTSVDSHDATWQNFAGKGTALMMIAGLSVALEKSGGKYLRGNKLNKSAVARAAIEAINEYGEGTDITPKALTDLLNEALSAKLTNLEV
ncbi:hypothetical protein [Enterobacter asburiae]